MYSVSILEEVAGGSGSIWIPILVLGWFLLMTIVGWQVSRNAPAGNGSQIPDTADPDNNPSEYYHGFFKMKGAWKISQALRF